MFRATAVELTEFGNALEHKITVVSLSLIGKIFSGSKMLVLITATSGVSLKSLEHIKDVKMGPMCRNLKNISN